MDTVIYVLEMIGTAVFAITGALAAGRKRMDIFGVVVLGCVTALGGGTLRDVILGIHPLFWISGTEYLVIAAIASVFTFVVAQKIKFPLMLLMYTDAVGLAVFTVIGFQKGYQATHQLSMGIVMSVITGIVGGMLRDVLSGEIPLILRREIYASACLFGALVLALLTYFQLPNQIAVIASFLATLTVRSIALYYNLSLSPFWLNEK